MNRRNLPTSQIFNQARMLGPSEINVVSGGAKGDSGALAAAKKIDLTDYLKLVDASIAKLKAM